RLVFRDFRSYFKTALLDEIGLAELQTYQAHLRRSILGQSTNRRFNTLCHFFRTCVDWGLLKDSPAARLKRLPPSRVKAKRALGCEELKSLFEAASPWLRNVLWFVLACGVRRSQACFLRWGAVDFRARYVHLESSDGFENKDYEANTLPLTELTESFLRHLLAEALAGMRTTGPSDFVFVDDRGQPIRPDRLTKEAKKLMKQCLNLDSGAVHILRHTSLTMRHRQGVSLDAVRAIAGHSNIKTTMLYLHSEPEFLRAEMTRTPLFEPFWISAKLVAGKRGT
ncbi:MAG: site-specific integrase, partial [Deltaproteobacteria bacterium]|nr:site-specific integrase [Deltaproteobacteria bacterium]